jgi:F-type H+-transporting ATPase subunit a
MATEGGIGLNIHPMDQFMVEPLFGGETVHWYTPTNATLWMALTVGAVSLLMIYGSRGRALVPTRAQSIAESIYGFAHKMIEDIAGKQGLKYFPYIMTLFLFILFANLLALLPTSFAPTSHIAVTAVLAVTEVIT